MAAEIISRRLSLKLHMNKKSSEDAACRYCKYSISREGRDGDGRKWIPGEG